MSAFRLIPLVSIVRRLGLAALALALAVAALPAAAPAAAADCQANYTVQRGDTLYKIGLKYNMTWDRIAQANNLSGEKIYAGQVLCIPQPRSSSGNNGNSGGTEVKYILALTDVNIRKGAGVNFGVITVLAGGQTAKVTGKSADGKWWRVICPDGTTGECYVSADASLTQPTTAPGTGTSQPGPVKTPTFRITAVVKDQTVSIQTADFPAGQKFTVRMGKIGTQAVNGVAVTTTESGQGGAFTATYTIPAELRGQSQIAIRLESQAGYFSYNWFWNNTAAAN
ncbi:MAG: LysM peptidoglycan-binding domain-containing protein [Anaerolineales bacterium]|nr:LysM peptidoglycan-binding domain-containing protein [Anaerolineales bacterium]